MRYSQNCSFDHYSTLYSTSIRSPHSMPLANCCFTNASQMQLPRHEHASVLTPSKAFSCVRCVIASDRKIARSAERPLSNLIPVAVTNQRTLATMANAHAMCNGHGQEHSKLKLPAMNSCPHLHGSVGVHPFPGTRCFA